MKRSSNSSFCLKSRTNISTPVGSIALAMAFHDLEMENICRAVRGERGSGGGGGGGSSTSATRPTPADLSLPLWTSEVTALLRVQPILHSLFFDFELATAAVLAASMREATQRTKSDGRAFLRLLYHLPLAHARAAQRVTLRDGFHTAVNERRLYNLELSELVSKLSVSIGYNEPRHVYLVFNSSLAIANSTQFKRRPSC